MTKEELLELREKLLDACTTILEVHSKLIEDKSQEENNLIEFVGEDEN